MSPRPRLTRRARLQAGALLLAGAAIAAGCSGDSGANTAPTPSSDVQLDLTAGPVVVEAAGAPATLADTDRDAIVDVVRQYVTAATLAPLRGRPVGDLAPLFTPAARGGLTGIDRAALVDEGIPEVTGRTRATAFPVGLTALSDRAGAIDLVGASFAFDIAGRARQGPVSVKRSGELVLMRSPEGWLIDSYRVTVERGGAGLGPSTTTATAGEGT
jgi:hypothetical protein